MLKLTLDNGLAINISPEMLQEIVKGYFIENTTFVDEDTEVKVELANEEATSAEKPVEPIEPKKPRRKYQRRKKSEEPEPVKEETPAPEVKEEIETPKEEPVVTTAERDLLQEAIDETPEVDEEEMVEEIVADIQAQEEAVAEKKEEPEVLDLTQSIFG